MSRPSSIRSPASPSRCCARPANWASQPCICPKNTAAWRWILLRRCWWPRASPKTDHTRPGTADKPESAPCRCCCSEPRSRSSAICRRVATAEMVAAYALSEPQAGSDALAARTRADLSPDGKHYILNGQKMWITNGGAADLYTIFAKVGGEKFTAFLVERKFPGFSSRRRRKEDGHQGQLHHGPLFRQCPVPVENVLGEIGRGHIIAFNILNIGRLKLGPVRLRRRQGSAARFARNTPRSAKPLANPSPSSA